MRNKNKYLSLINFMAKTSSSGIFEKMNTIFTVDFFLSHCKHGITWGVRTPCWVLQPWCHVGCLNAMPNRPDFSYPNQFHLNFHFR